MSNINQTTLEKDFCINCGICKFVCPVNAIEMKWDKYRELKPCIDADKCINCGECVKYCPNTFSKIQDEAKKISDSKSPREFGVKDYKTYVAWNGSPDRINSASGGVITKLACELLGNNKIDGVIHAQRLKAPKAQPHYQACISASVNDIKHNAGSIYAPISFDEVFNKLESPKTYLFIATPCIIRAVKKLFAEHKKLSDIKIITAALICSHNVNGQYTDYLADSFGISENEQYYVDLRNKDNIPDANNFNTHYYNEKTIIKENRFKTKFTKTWRNHYFAMNICNYCPDFWGYEADISVKDAWGKKWTDDPLGKSIVIVRNPELDVFFNNNGLEIEELNNNALKLHQKTTSIYKQQEAFKKCFQPIWHPDNIKNGLFANIIISKISKVLYIKYGYKFTNFILSLLSWCGGKSK